MKVKRWARLEPWKPSSQQVIAYMRHQGYKIPLNRKTRRPTSDDESLKKLIAARERSGRGTEPVLSAVLRVRAMVKGIGYLKGTYIGLDGRFHCQFTFHPRTGRLSARSPNLMQVPSGRGGDIEARIAKSIRRSIYAPEGYVLLEIDYKAQEALLLGYFAGDETYMRMARLGVYSFVLAPALGIRMDMSAPNAELAKTCDRITESYPNEYADLKQTCLALGYGEQVDTVAKRLGIPYEAAKKYADLYDQVAPSIKKFQQDVRLRAHKEQKLTNPWGYSQPFYHVFKRSKSDPERWLLGDEANEVLAFLPQSSGAFILRRALRDLATLRRNTHDAIIPVVPIHDAVLCFVKEERLRELAGAAQLLMEDPIPQLGGLVIKTSAKWGQNWGDMKKL